MDELVRWLSEQLDEDERIARAASWCDEAASWRTEPSPFGARHAGQRWYVEDAMDDGVISHVDPAASDDEGVARHIARHDPARVLREIDAKRQIIKLHERLPDGAFCVTCDAPSGIPGREHACATLRLLVSPYADRPGYREEWRP